ncbi:MAG: non-lysosomal glucosylceramidase, partial [Ruaniaceae bacterium]|nr:non-lysosomal glucosylceramidase [Ruaniaceae bacterium]
NVSIGPDGGLRQWQLPNSVNHLGDAPGSFFAIRACQVEPPFDTIRILQSSSISEPRPSPLAPLVDDDAVPDWQRSLVRRVGGFATTRMSATYPFARLSFTDPGLPLAVELEAFTPFHPHDADGSGIPAATFAFTLTNTGDLPLHGWLGASLLNLVGADGIVNPVGVTHPGFGGNANVIERVPWTTLIGENVSLNADDPLYGQVALSSAHPTSQVYPQWTDTQHFIDFLASRAPGVTQPLAPGDNRPDPQGHAPAARAQPSAPGSSWCGGLADFWTLAPGASTTLTYVLAWYFPNRYVNFNQFGPANPAWGASKFWLGNHYATRFSSVRDVIRNIREDTHRESTARWAELFSSATLHAPLADFFASQAIPLRSPTCFRAADGTFFGFEGSAGASTGMWGARSGGSCPLNCTHVWNYEHALAYLFPEQERSMRRTEFEVMQAPDGSIPHRVIVPTFLPQLWDGRVYGPEEPALDGMLGTVLKTYREVRAGWALAEVAAYWPQLQRLMHHIEGRWVTAGDGTLRGIQPSTHDIDLAGTNPFMGTLWLAALRAYERLATLFDDAEQARWAGELFARARAAYEEIMWTGEYYRQVLDDGDPIEFQWGDGCLADQLIGQWWAHELDLGYVLDPHRVRTALASIVRHNLQHGFTEISHPFRVYADGDDTGLVMATWPHGGRPDTPTRYADEVWSGVEYQVAAHCIREGLHSEAQAIIDGALKRRDGSRRNPFNEIECGDYYARALSGWTILRAATGWDYDAVTQSVRIRPVADFFADADLHFPFVTGSAWGSVTITERVLTIRVTGGTLGIAALEVMDAVLDAPSAPLNAGDRWDVAF